MKIKLTESKLRQIVNESVKNVLTEMFDEEFFFDDDMWCDYDEVLKETYKWFVHINEKQHVSDKFFNTIEEAEQDCDRFLEKIDFYSLAKKLNDGNKERVVATIEVMNGDKPIDTVLVNIGFGWYD